MVLRVGQLALVGAAVAVGAAAVTSTQGAGHTVDAVLVGSTTPTVTAPPAVRPTTTPSANPTTTPRPVKRVHRAAGPHATTYRTLSR
jgi:hypothetical protein